MYGQIFSCNQLNINLIMVNINLFLKIFIADSLFMKKRGFPLTYSQRFVIFLEPL